MAKARTDESVVGAGSLVAAGMMAMNVMVYAFTLLSAHTLDPGDFGGLGAILAVLIVTSVGALALQATGARTIAIAEPAQRQATVSNILASTRMLSLVLGAALLVLSPLLRSLLDVPWIVALMVPLAVIPLTLLGGFAGVLQGCREWKSLTAVFLALGAGRFIIGGLALLLSGSLTSAVAGLTLGAYLPAIVGWFACRRLLSGPPGSASLMLREVWHNGHTLLAFFALTNLDVLLARNLLTADESGLYAAGAILTKSCLFLPQFVIIVAFPGMAEDQARDDQNNAWLRPLGLVAAIGAVVTLGTAVLSDLAVTFVGGSQYGELSGYIWLFAIEGTMFALLQMGVYRQIARRATTVAPMLWIAVASLGVIALVASRFLDDFDQRTLVLLVIAVSSLIMFPVMRAKSGLVTAPPATQP
jgi:O-antigen/teichoic acid export membrane protein